MEERFNIAIGQSGGPTTVINASLYGAIIEAFENRDKIDKVYGMINGIEGFIRQNYAT
jgi:6-phosphofructokinase 1